LYTFASVLRQFGVGFTGLYRLPFGLPRRLQLLAQSFVALERLLHNRPDLLLLSIRQAQRLRHPAAQESRVKSRTS
jgi:hypothetical protein